jgi:hypothetical protein
MISAAAYRSGLLEQRIETTSKVVSILIVSQPITLVLNNTPGIGIDGL